MARFAPIITAETKRKMPSRKFEAQMKFAIPMPILLTGLLLPFTMGYFDTSFLIGFCLATLIFVTTIILQIDDPEDDENTTPPKEQPDEYLMEETQGLTFYLRGDCVEVRTQNGHAYRWIPTDNGLNYMVKGGLKTGIFHEEGNWAYISFWDDKEVVYTCPVNPWAASPDIGDKSLSNKRSAIWVKDYQISSA